MLSVVAEVPPLPTYKIIVEEEARDIVIRLIKKADQTHKLNVQTVCANILVFLLARGVMNEDEVEYLLQNSIGP